MELDEVKIAIGPYALGISLALLSLLVENISLPSTRPEKASDECGILQISYWSNRKFRKSVNDTQLVIVSKISQRRPHRTLVNFEFKNYNL